MGLNLGISKDILTVRKSGLIGMKNPTGRGERIVPVRTGSVPVPEPSPAAGTSRLHSTVDGEVVRRVGIAHQSGKLKSTTVSLFLSATFKITDVASR